MTQYGIFYILLNVLKVPACCNTSSTYIQLLLMHTFKNNASICLLYKLKYVVSSNFYASTCIHLFWKESNSIYTFFSYMHVSLYWLFNYLALLFQVLETLKKKSIKSYRPSRKGWSVEEQQACKSDYDSCISLPIYLLFNSCGSQPGFGFILLIMWS